MSKYERFVGAIEEDTPDNAGAKFVLVWKQYPTNESKGSIIGYNCLGEDFGIFIKLVNYEPIILFRDREGELREFKLNVRKNNAN